MTSPLLIAFAWSTYDSPWAGETCQTCVKAGSYRQFELERSLFIDHLDLHACLACLNGPWVIIILPSES